VGPFLSGHGQISWEGLESCCVGRFWTNHQQTVGYAAFASADLSPSLESSTARTGLSQLVGVVKRLTSITRLMPSCHRRLSKHTSRSLAHIFTSIKRQSHVESTTMFRPTRSATSATGARLEFLVTVVLLESWAEVERSCVHNNAR